MTLLEFEPRLLGYAACNRVTLLTLPS